MRRKTIQVPLTEAGVDRAIRELKAWQKRLEQGTAALLKALAEEGVQVASARFQSAQYDGQTTFPYPWKSAIKTV